MLQVDTTGIMSTDQYQSVPPNCIPYPLTVSWNLLPSMLSFAVINALLGMSMTIKYQWRLVLVSFHTQIMHTVALHLPPVDWNNDLLGVGHCFAWHVTHPFVNAAG